jgi:hypothetical protein
LKNSQKVKHFFLLSFPRNGNPEYSDSYELSGFTPIRD